MEEAKIYKAKLHIATSPFSFVEIEVEDAGPKIIKLNDAMLKHYKNEQK